MPNFSAVRTDHVLRAVRLHDELGEEETSATHGYDRDRGYSLVHDGGTYAAKAIVGVACGFATGEPLTSAEFSGGKDGAAAVLRGLGFASHRPGRRHDRPAGGGRVAHGAGGRG